MAKIALRSLLSAIRKHLYCSLWLSDKENYYFCKSFTIMPCVDDKEEGVVDLQ
jgi:beta-arrestin-2